MTDFCLWVSQVIARQKFLRQLGYFDFCKAFDHIDNNIDLISYWLDIYMTYYPDFRIQTDPSGSVGSGSGSATLLLPAQAKLRYILH